MKQKGILFALSILILAFLIVRHGMKPLPPRPVELARVVAPAPTAATPDRINAGPTTKTIHKRVWAKRLPPRHYSRRFLRRLLQGRTHMAWKTGRSRVLEAKGNLTGSIVGTAYEVLPSINLSARFSASAFGLSVSGHQIYNNSYADTDMEWIVAASSGSATDTQDHVIWHATAAGYTGFNYSIGGTFSLSVPVEEWVDVGIIARSSNDVDNGIIDSPLRCTLRFYEKTVAGGTATATVTSGTVTATAASTITSASEVGYSGSLTLYGGAVSSLGTNATQTLHMTMKVGNVAVVGSDSYADANIVVNNTDGAYLSLSDGGGTHGYSGTINTTLAPPKSFSFTGALRNMDAAYPGTVTINASRYLGDPTPTNPQSDGFSVSSIQRNSSSSVSISDNGSVAHSSSTNVNEWQPFSPSVDGAWCRANGEYTTYQVTDDAGNSSTRYVNDDAFHLHGWTFGGVTLTPAASLILDTCTAATNWTGATAAGGGLQNTGATMTFNPSPPKNLSGYAFLRSRWSFSTAGLPFSLSFGGKTWSKDYKGRPLLTTTSSVDYDVNLCDPTNDATLSDTQDTRWPDPNVGTGADGGFATEVDGPQWGITYCGQGGGYSRSFGGLAFHLPAGVTGTLTGLSQVRHQDVKLSILPDHTPYIEQEGIQFAPAVTNDSGTVTTPYLSRLLVADTDGRQSLEMEQIQVSKVEGGASGVTYYIPHPVTLAQMAVNAGLTTAQSADSNYPAGQWPGWAIAVNAPAPDGTTNLHDGYLNSSCPAAWLLGGGLLWNAGTGGWQSGIGMDATGGTSASAQMLFNSIDWYPGCEDPFGLGVGTAGDGVLRLVGHKIYGCQIHGVVLKDDHSGPALSQTVTLNQVQPVDTPLAAGVTAVSVEVGTVTTASDPTTAEGEYRTTGAGETARPIGYAHSTDTSTPPLTTTSFGAATAKTVTTV